jgi:hypothetical protein
MRWYHLGLTTGVLVLTALTLAAAPQHGRPVGAKGARPPGPVFKVRPGGAGGHPHTDKTAAKGKGTNPARRPGKKLTTGQKQTLRKFVNSAPLTPQEKGAVDKVISGGQLSADDRSALSALLVRNPPGLTAEVREALNQALADDMEQRLVAFSRRYLRVHNDTGEQLTVWLRYQTLTVNKTWSWYPAAPQPAVAYRVDPGAVLDLEHEKWRVEASRVRIWARSSGGREWGDYRGRDLWLVPETDDRGQHQYRAAERETFTFTFER